MTYKFTGDDISALNEKLDDARSLQVQHQNQIFHHNILNHQIATATVSVGRFNIATPEADRTFAFEERDMSGRSLFVFSGSPADTDQEAIIEFADAQKMTVLLDGRKVTLITDQPKIATLFKLTFGGDV